MPVISVVVPCYQQAEYLADAVRSVLGQTFRDLEVVIVDDGSTDQPLERLGELASDPRVISIRQENAGLPLSRNVGIARSSGSCLVFLDADDWLAPTFCERLHQVLAAESGWGIAYCDVVEVYEPGAERVRPEGQPYSVGASRRQTDGDILPALLIGGYFTPNCVMVRREVLDRVGLFDAALGGHADWDLWLRIAAAGYPAHYIDQKLAFYRLHRHNMSRNAEHMRETRVRTLRKLLAASPDIAAHAVQELCRTSEEHFHSGTAAQREARRLNEELSQVRRRQAEEQQRDADYFRESQAWISSLEGASKWHEEQALEWKNTAEELSNSQLAEVADCAARIDQLSSLHARQTEAWKERDEQRTSLIERQSVRIRQLEEASGSLWKWWSFKRRSRQ